MIDRKTQEAQVLKNYAAFKKMSFDFYDKGKFALLRDGKLVEIMTSKADARKMAAKLFGGQPYSIQEISPRRVDLGAMNRALR